MRVGFLGAGRMAFALTRGFLAAGITKAESIIASSPKNEPSLLEDMKKIGCKSTYDNRDVVRASDILLLALKPSVVPIVLKEVASLVTPKHLTISIALGVSVGHIEQILPDRSRVIRVMPNTPAVVLQGASVYSCGASATEADREVVSRLFSSVGICEEVPENLIDAVTALSSSGPAYIYMVIEAMADGGVKMGLPRDLSQKLAVQTVVGAAKMVMETKKHPAALKDDVCSPAGCTIEAVHQLEKCGLRSALINAVEAATIKCKETGTKPV